MTATASQVASVWLLVIGIMVLIALLAFPAVGGAVSQLTDGSGVPAEAGAILLLTGVLGLVLHSYLNRGKGERASGGLG